MEFCNLKPNSIPPDHVIRNRDILLLIEDKRVGHRKQTATVFGIPRKIIFHQRAVSES